MRTSSRTGNAITASPSQLGNLTRIFFGEEFSHNNISIFNAVSFINCINIVTVFPFPTKELEVRILNKQTYTDTEFQKVLQDLFVEKKRVKELQKKNQEIDTERNTSQKQLPEESCNISLKDPVLDEHITALQSKVTQLNSSIEKKSRLIIQQNIHHNTLQKEYKSLQGHTSNSDTHKLKRAFIVIKRKYDELVDSKEKIEQKNSELTEKNNLLVSSQDSKKKLSEDYKELSNTNDSLGKELSKATENLDSVAIEKKSLSSKLEKSYDVLKKTKEKFIELNNSLNSYKQGQQEQQEQADSFILELEEKEELIKNLQSYKDSYKRENENRKKLELLLEEERNTRLSLEKENLEKYQQLSTTTKKLQEQLTQKEEHSSELKQQLVKTINVKNNLEKELGTAQEYLDINKRVKDTSTELQQELQKTQDNVSTLKKYIETIEDQNNKLSEENNDIINNTRHEFEKILIAKDSENKKINDVLNKEVNSLRPFLEEKASQLNNITREYQELKKYASLLRRQVKEHEYHTKTMQQHLAKKLKETALIHDDLEQKKVENKKLMQDVTNHENNTALLENELKNETAEREQTQAIYDGKVASTETKLKHWEEKYLSLHNDWQKKEMQIVELEKIQIEYQQLQGVLNNIKNFIPSNQTTPQTYPTTQFKSSPAATTPINILPPPTKQNDLFTQSAASAIKENLF